MEQPCRVVSHGTPNPAPLKSPPKCYNSWLNPKQWVIVHTSDLMMIIRWSTIFAQLSNTKLGKLGANSLQKQYNNYGLHLLLPTFMTFWCLQLYQMQSDCSCIHICVWLSNKTFKIIHILRLMSLHRQSVSWTRSLLQLDYCYIKKTSYCVWNLNDMTKMYIVWISNKQWYTVLSVSN